MQNVCLTCLHVDRKPSHLSHHHYKGDKKSPIFENFVGLTVETFFRLVRIKAKKGAGEILHGFMSLNMKRKVRRTEPKRQLETLQYRLEKR